LRRDESTYSLVDLVATIAGQTLAISSVVSGAKVRDGNAHVVSIEVPEVGAFLAGLSIPVPELAAKHSRSNRGSRSKDALSIVEVVSSVASCASSIGIVGATLVRNRHTNAVDRHPIL